MCSSLKFCQQMTRQLNHQHTKQDRGRSNRSAKKRQTLLALSSILVLCDSYDRTSMTGAPHERDIELNLRSIHSSLSTCADNSSKYANHPGTQHLSQLSPMTPPSRTRGPAIRRDRSNAQASLGSADPPSSDRRTNAAFLHGSKRRSTRRYFGCTSNSAHDRSEETEKWCFETGSGTGSGRCESTQHEKTRWIRVLVFGLGFVRSHAQIKVAGDG